MDKQVTGWERENRVIFDDIVVNYDKSRWDYPGELFEDVIKYSQTESKIALEIGAGTGKATAPFLDAGYGITAIEMGANMAEFLREKFKENKNFHVITATFEEAVLEDSTYDLIYAASAFHWVDAEIGCPKVFRLLRDKGTFALFRNHAKPANNELFIECQAFYEEYYYTHYTGQRPSSGHLSSEKYLEPDEITRCFGCKNFEHYGFIDVVMKLYNVNLSYSADEYINLLDTYSDHRALPEDKRTALYKRIRETIIRHGGYKELNCVYQLYMGRKG